MERNGDLKSLIEQMEANYDAQETASNEEKQETPTFAPEVAQFLEEMDRRFGDDNPQS